MSIIHPKSFLIVLCMLWSVFAYGQATVHRELRTPTWNLIGLKYEKQVKRLEWVTVFPKELRAINQQIIELPGYIIPTKVGNRFSTFMLSIVPVESCPFCGTGDIPSMVEVKMKGTIDWTDKVVKLRGRFVINDSGDKQSEFFLLDAVKL